VWARVDDVEPMLASFGIHAAALAGLTAYGAGSAGTDSSPAHVIYLALDGERIFVTPQLGVDCQGSDPGCGVSDSHTNESWLPAGDEAWIDVPAFDADRFGVPGDVRRALVDQVALSFAGLNVWVTDQRPDPDVDYAMVVVGGRAADLSLPAGIAGFAPLDCHNAHDRDVAFTFSDDIPYFTAVVRVTAQEAGHTYGLEHVSERDFIMYPSPDERSAGFARTCVPIVPDSISVNPDGIKCAHTCSSLTHQNAYDELLEALGPDPLAPPPDLEPPTMAVRRPFDGQTYTNAPASFRIEIDAADDVGVGHAVLSVNGEPTAEDPTFPFAFEVRRWPEGSYALEVRVFDAAGNVADERLDVYVGDDPDAGAGIVPTGSVTPYLEPSGEPPPRCRGDKQCPAGTQCLDGVCLRPQIDCSVGLAGRDRVPVGLLGLFGLWGWRRRKKRATATRARR